VAVTRDERQWDRAQALYFTQGLWLSSLLNNILYDIKTEGGEGGRDWWVIDYRDYSSIDRAWYTDEWPATVTGKGS
jgi:hypothetical protein